MPLAPTDLRYALIVDDDRHTRETLARVAPRLPLAVRTARDLESLREATAADPPAILIAPATTEAITAARPLRRRFGTAIVLVGSSLTPPQAAEVAALDPDGFLCKPLHADQMESTVRLAIRRRVTEATSGQCEDLAQTLRQIAALVQGSGVLGTGRDAEGPTARVTALRPREQDVVRLLFENCRVPAVAERLGISRETVRNHLKNAFRRVGVHSQQELIEYFRATAGSPVTALRSGDGADDATGF